MPSAPASLYGGGRQADVQATQGMTALQGAQNYPQQTYQQFAPGLATMAGPSGYDPAATVQAGNFMTGQGMGMYGLGQQLYNLGMDPQSDLYNRMFQQQQEQTRAGEAARGLATTPVGAAMESQANRDFNMAWQNAQLQRALQGAAGAQGMFGAGAQNILGGQGLAGAVPGQQLGVMQGLQQAGLGAYALPQQNIQNWQNYLSAASNAQQQAYQAQLQAYQAKQQQQAGMFGGLGYLGGALLGGPVGGKIGQTVGGWLGA